MAETSDALKERLKRLNNGEFPSAAAQTGMITRRALTIEVTIGELAKAIEANPKHPIAQAYKKTVLENTQRGAKGEPDTLLDKNKVVIDRVDLEALLDNKTVVHNSVGVTVEEGYASEEVTKAVGDPVRPATAPESFDKVKTAKSTP